ncbi:riboflavin biosynthesis protein RibD [Candidatus Omnitrophus magneticus]|uniref:Riboflavin biosynthesis protein RibD n=1 Tax=Candidatus Omnitrophus magneticus TaxID=1609969 RepID=A0A0F0CUH1_9BACT|nr:riboflavin biosynthesis protein RibD [Candidatus Omnitrophus magneticus]
MLSAMVSDEQKKIYMLSALRLAKKALDKTYPNPMVGAVIVKNGKIIGKGYHVKAGANHAEVAAIKSAGNNCRSSEMFVTLEPCAHYGKTPPCVNAVIESGIKKVFIAMKDPNPIVSGRGIKILKNAGIEVETGICEDLACQLNAKYIKFITDKMPYVTGKIAESLDGKTSARDKSSKWITDKKTRELSKKSRALFDAILVGINTVLKDNPTLLPLDAKKINNRYIFRRVIVDSKARISLDSNLVKSAGISPIIIATTDLAPLARSRKISSLAGVEILKFKNKNGRVPLKELLKKLAEMGMVNILAEGGAELLGSLVDERLIDEWMIYIAPKIIGGRDSAVKGLGVQNIHSAINLTDIKIKKIGNDFLIQGKTCLPA